MKSALKWLRNSENSGFQDSGKKKFFLKYSGDPKSGQAWIWKG